MFKTACAALVLIATALFPVIASAGGLKAPPTGFLKSELIKAGSTRRAPSAMPPANFKGQWWTDPAGCQYSRAGRPGELVWFLTAVPKGARCPEFIQQKVSDHAYRPPYMIDG